MCIVDFVCWVVVIALAAAFALALANKWGWIERMQVHTRWDFLYKLLSCHFCTTWWICVLVALGAVAITGHWTLLLAPPCSTLIALRLW